MSDDEFTQGVDSLKMTRVDWRWAAMKGFWDKESKQWNESAGGQAAYLLQKTKRMKKREERPHRSALRQAGPSSASRRLHGASLRSGIIEELPPRTADNWALSLSGASSRDLSSHTPDIPSLKGGMVVGGRGPEVQPDNVPNVLSSGFQPGSWTPNLLSLGLMGLPVQCGKDWTAPLPAVFGAALSPWSSNASSMGLHGGADIHMGALGLLGQSSGTVDFSPSMSQPNRTMIVSCGQQAPEGISLGGGAGSSGMAISADHGLATGAAHRATLSSLQYSHDSLYRNLGGATSSGLHQPGDASGASWLAQTVLPSCPVRWAGIDFRDGPSGYFPSATPQWQCPPAFPAGYTPLALPTGASTDSWLLAPPPNALRPLAAADTGHSLADCIDGLGGLRNSLLLGGRPLWGGAGGLPVMVEAALPHNMGS